ncbi:hypothetical protein VOLCADRAFT_119208 [Volvox carteri f. nagariensis]|uniref:Replication termination factor 2 n=1 Tax=Volvox carteri f. nagariensis TaxID=3068 RepID=D8UB29_VOLCA|nr:uncharacterized protein VOLCADRAFT_119208 [Volvox carteri f. nagariensis]EFJ43098.1 hypothetical protein VOLCADRAFT_119208 [Volvox carteri f. nagariensis]|eukprot:XP_002955897.1 hypothetical protein VOLCADRAFT_119208 [Volvox carteri f. nagariensis]
MGLDGGTIVTRSDVLRGQSWRVAQSDRSRSTRGGNASRVPTETADEALRRSTAWSTCALSSQPLQAPIVACSLGRLYNKDAVLRFLLAKKGHMTSHEALLEYANQLRVAAAAAERATSTATGLGIAAAATGEAPATSSSVGAATSFVCPITLLPCDRHPCSALRPCGHVISERALANIRRGGSSGSGDGDASCPVQALREQLRTAAAAAAAAKAQAKAGKKRKAPDAPATEPANGPHKQP